MFVVFAGAGASTAVDAQQYPTTTAFFDRLPKAITKSPAFTVLTKRLQIRAGERRLDIEDVLWALNELRSWCELSTDSNGIVGTLCQGSELAVMSGHSADMGNVQQMLRMLNDRLRELEGGINALVHEYYAERPSEESLASNWLPLLKVLRGRTNRIDVVTTNYDMVIEEAIRHSGCDIDTGREYGDWSIFNTNIADHGQWAQGLGRRGGRLLKIHGSVDWVRRGGNIHYGNFVFTGTHSNHVIVYPGYKGTPNTAPFIALHESFRNVLSSCEAILFIGYAFRDVYVNSILREATPRSAHITIINPAKDLPGVPFDAARVRHIARGFDAEAVALALDG